MDIAVIMDRSGSVGKDNFEKAKQFVISLVHKLQISSHGTRIGIIPYHSDAQVAVKFADVAHQTPDAMTRLIRGIPYTSGMTRTDVAIELANTQLFTNAGGLRSDKPNVLIVMTDGKTNAGSKPYKTVLAPLKVGRVLSYSISVSIIFGSSSDLLRIFGSSSGTYNLCKISRNCSQAFRNHCLRASSEIFGKRSEIRRFIVVRKSFHIVTLPLTPTQNRKPLALRQSLNHF